MISIHRSFVWFIAIAICVLGFFGVMYGDRVRAYFMNDAYTAELQAIKVCAATRNIIPCVRPHVRELLVKYSAKDLIEAIVQEKLPSNQCHYVIHTIGQELYTRYKDTEQALAQCSSICNSACLHGVTGEAFRTELNVVDDIDLAHLGLEELQEIGKNLCKTGSTCHGVGHALFSVQKDLDKALSVCPRVAGEFLNDCYRGVYMEYTDFLNTRSIWQDSYALSVRPRIEDLPSLCDRSSEAEIAACFYYFPLAVRRAYRDEGVTESREASVLLQAKPICTSLSDPLKRRWCIFGLGATLHEKLLASEHDAIRTCGQFSEHRDQTACMAGMFSLVIEYGYTDQAMAYCTALSDESQRTTCYRVLFEKIDSLYRSIDDAKKFCPVEEIACAESAEAARRHEVDEFF